MSQENLCHFMVYLMVLSSSSWKKALVSDLLSKEADLPRCFNFLTLEMSKLISDGIPRSTAKTSQLLQNKDTSLKTPTWISKLPSIQVKIKPLLMIQISTTRRFHVTSRVERFLIFLLWVNLLSKILLQMSNLISPPLLDKPIHKP